jgi:hypothetical protein
MAAAKLLFELISSPDTAVPVHILTGVELVAGDTTAPMPSRRLSGRQLI